MAELTIAQRRLLNFVGNRGVMNHAEYLQREDGQTLVREGYVVLSNVGGVCGARLTEKGRQWFERIKETA